jgi:hypothetical protein
MSYNGYNGHRNWNHWNVNLWLMNDEGLYRMAVEECRHHARAKAAEQILDTLHAAGIEKTPDGAPYTVTSIRAALRGM